MVHRVEVVILQHPLEVGHAKGSARLLHLCLPHSQLVVGEVFEPQTLQALLHGPLPGGATTSLPRRAVLLYPDPAQNPAPGCAVPPAVPPNNWRCEPEALRLLVLDGTWRKSRKMLHLNPLLQRLPRLSLRAVAASRYPIRQAHRPDQRSTLEATCAALAQLEGSAEPFAPLLAAFDGFVAQQRSYQNAERPSPA